MGFVMWYRRQFSLLIKAFIRQLLRRDCVNLFVSLRRKKGAIQFIFTHFYKTVPVDRILSACFVTELGLVHSELIDLEKFKMATGTGN